MSDIPSAPPPSPNPPPGPPPSPPPGPAAGPAVAPPPPVWDGPADGSLELNWIWLDDPANVRRLLRWCWGALGLLVVCDLGLWVAGLVAAPAAGAHGGEHAAAAHHPLVFWQAWPLGYALYGGLGCAAIILACKMWFGPLLKRKAGYYD